MSLRHPSSGMQERAKADDNRLVVQRFQKMKMILRPVSVPVCVVGSPPSHHQPGASHWRLTSCVFGVSGCGDILCFAFVALQALWSLVGPLSCISNSSFP